MMMMKKSKMKKKNPSKNRTSWIVWISEWKNIEKSRKELLSSVRFIFIVSKPTWIESNNWGARNVLMLVTSLLLQLLFSSTFNRFCFTVLSFVRIIFRWLFSFLSSNTVLFALSLPLPLNLSVSSAMIFFLADCKYCSKWKSVIHTIGQISALLNSSQNMHFALTHTHTHAHTHWTLCQFQVFYLSPSSFRTFDLLFAFFALF